MLNRYDSNNIYIQEILSNYFTEGNLLLKDKKLITTIVNGVVRLKGRYDYILSHIYKGDYNKLKKRIKNLLYIGCYQIEELDSIPNHAAVSTSVNIAKYTLKGTSKLINAILRKFITKKDQFSINSKNKNLRES